MSQQELVDNFIMISGASKDKANSFLKTASWNLELALSNYFEHGTKDAEPLNFGPQPTASNKVDQNEAYRIIQEQRDAEYQLEIEHVLPSAGLQDKASGKEVPLKGILVQADVKDFIADVSMKLRFTNNLGKPIEAIFKFVAEDAAVHGLQVDIDGKKVVAECFEKKEAFAQYDDAISSGHGAFLMEKGKRDGFSLSVGNLPNGKECVVTINYLQELELEGEAFRFGLPVARNCLPSGSSSNVQDEVPEGLNVNINYNMSRPITGIQSPTHALESSFEGKKGTSSLAKSELNRRFELVVEVDDPHRTSALIETTEDSAAIAVALFPRIESDDEPKTEVIFLVDRSGSMAGSRMTQAKNALQLFLRSLPENCKFNIIGFGDTYEKLYDVSQPYSEATLEYASAHVTHMDSNLAGTNIYNPLRDIFRAPVNREYPRQIFLLTDGEVKNTAEVLKMVKDSVDAYTRIFTFGIGSDASQALVKGIAKFGRGKAEFVVSGQKLEAPVMRQVKRALQPIVSDITVEWGDIEQKARSVAHKLPPIFDGDRLLFYAFIEKASLSKLFGVHFLKISGQVGPHTLPFQVSVDLDNAVVTTKSGTIHRFAAHSLITDLEADNAKLHKQEITDLGVKYQLISKYTSFVAVHEQQEMVEGDMNRVKLDTSMGKAEAFGTGGIPKEPMKELETMKALEEAKISMDNNISYGLRRPEEHQPSEVVFPTVDYLQNLRRTSISEIDSNLSGVLSKKELSYGNYSYNSYDDNDSSDGDEPCEEEESYAEFAQDCVVQPPSYVCAMPSQAPKAQGPPPPPPGQSTMIPTAQSIAMPSAPLAQVMAPPPPAQFGSSYSEDVRMDSKEDRKRSVSRHSESGRGMKMKKMKDKHAEEKVFALPEGKMKAAPPKPAKLAKPLVGVSGLVMLAKANGAFELDESLATIVSASLSALLNALPSALQEYQQVWATFIALAYLEKCCSDTKDEWELVFTKAKKFIVKTLPDLAWDDLLTQAKALVN